MFVVDGPWRWGRNYRWDDNILTNLIAAFFLFTPVVASFIGGWLGYGVYYLVQSPKETAAQPTNRLNAIASTMQTPENVN